MPKDRLSEIYPINYYSYSPRNTSFVNGVKEWLDAFYFRRVLNQIPGNNIKVLDIGGGTGWLLDQVKACDDRVCLTQVVDIDERMQAHAELSGHGYYAGGIESYDTNEKFDMILMLNLIEHVSNPTVVLSKIRQLLSDKGQLMIKTPNFDSLDARIFRNNSWAGLHTPRHFVLFNKDSLLNTCREAGLELSHFTYTQGAPFWSISFLDLLKRFGIVDVSVEKPAPYHPIIPYLQAAFAAFDFARKPFAKLSQMQVLLHRA